MANIQIPYASDRPRAVITMPQGLDSNGSPRGWSGTASVDDYATCYAAKGSAAAGACIFVVVKGIPGAGQVKTVNLTISSKDVDGNALPDVTQAFDVYGPPAPPLATHLNTPLVVSTASGALYAPPADPGSASVSIP